MTSTLGIKKIQHPNGTNIATLDSSGSIAFAGASTVAGTLGVTGAITGTLATAAQTNITSVGTLTSFRSTGIDDNADATAITITSAENVGIGTTSPDEVLHIHSDSITRLKITGSSGQGEDNGIKIFQNGVNTSIVNADNGYMRFYTNNTERMRIDASGNVLMGGTETVVYADTSGNQLEYATYFALKRETANSSQAVAYINNTGADGNIIDLRKDGTTVGSIGTLSGYLTIGDDVGILFNNANPSISAFNASTNANRDGAIDIGASNARFKDLYLSGGLKVGGTGTANTLDDYEEGTFTPTLALSGATLASTGGTGRYTKIGRHVYVEGKVTRNTAAGGVNSTVQIESLPFASLNANSITEMGSGTIWMDEGGPGVRNGDTVGHAYVPANTSRADVVRGTSSGAQTSYRYGIGGEMTNGRPLYFNFVYTTN